MDARRNDMDARIVLPLTYSWCLLIKKSPLNNLGCLFHVSRDDLALMNYLHTLVMFLAESPGAFSAIPPRLLFSCQPCRH